jgi:protein SCO1/2
MEGLFAALNDLPLTPGSDYQVVAFSIDPRETPAVAQEEQAKYAIEFPRVMGAGVHLLTSSAASSSALADALGFRYSFDAASGQYAHDVEIVVLTPTGAIASYAPTLAPTSATLQSALDAAGKGVVARSVDRLVLFCFRLLPANGRNTPLIEHILQGIAATTVLTLGGLLWTLHRRGRGPRA